MSLLTNASNAFWRYVSPTKQHKGQAIDPAVPLSESSRKRRRSASPARPAYSQPLQTLHKRSKVVRSIEVDYTSHKGKAVMHSDADMLDDTAVDPDQDDDIAMLMSDVHVAPPTSPGWHNTDATDDTLIDDKTPDRAPSIFSSPARSPTPPSHFDPPTTAEQLPSDDLSTFPLSVQPLITRLIRRGREPLLPSHWTQDFRFLPTSLFLPPRSPDQPVITALSLSDFRAQKAFSDLLLLGGRTRDKILVRRHPERVLVSGVSAYAAWALADRPPAAAPAPVPDLLAMAHGDRDADAAALQLSLARGLVALEDAWLEWAGDAADELPTLYGVVVSHSLMAVACWTPGAGGGAGRAEDRARRVAGGMRGLGMFDWGVRGLDVWNSLAVALLVMHVRDEMRGWAA